MQVIQYNKSDVVGMIRRYPIIDLVMVVVIRASLGSNTIKYAAVQTELLIQYFENMFEVAIKKSPALEFVGTGMTIHESHEYPYVIREYVLPGLQVTSPYSEEENPSWSATVTPCWSIGA
jgi:hypothetical protein